MQGSPCIPVEGGDKKLKLAQFLAPTRRLCHLGVPGAVQGHEQEVVDGLEA
jgi:hypothetical protein